jgi:hypothetical protein
MFSWGWRAIMCPFSARAIIIGDGDLHGVSADGSRCCAALIRASILSSPGDNGWFLCPGLVCNGGARL